MAPVEVLALDFAGDDFAGVDFAEELPDAPAFAALASAVADFATEAAFFAVV
ncbi:hypothetical protein [Brevibacterium sp. UCMA 11752]|uniref:hypothetical protein n=1 Tax=Brevibacterium sp. UCMA 11752 TaxID=2745946 RepID=UPI001F46764D|nr:hypothetical protein [Brevibacterium sp. UCMA 11752]